MAQTVADVLRRRNCRRLYTVECGVSSAEIHRCGKMVVITMHEGSGARLLIIEGPILTNKYYNIGDEEKEAEIADLLDTVLEARMGAEGD